MKRRPQYLRVRTIHSRLLEIPGEKSLVREYDYEVRELRAES